MTDGARCGSATAGVLRADHCNDWGALFGFNVGAPRDVSAAGPQGAFEGFSFWARAPGNTGKSFTLVLDDTNTVSSAGKCKDYGDAGVAGQTTGPGTDQNGNPISSGGSVSVSPPDACGNSYSAMVVVSTGWRFYTVPFTQFTQAANQNRVPNAVFAAGTVPGTGLVTSGLMSLVMRMPREERMELWIDALSFYRKKGAARPAGADAGTAGAGG